MEDLHLPWTDQTLEELLLEIIPRGEATKIDFKRQLDLTPSSQAELLKDILAFANTYDYPYQNYGFIIIGAEANKLCFTEFNQNADSLQATIDELVKNYIEPFIPTHIKIFGSTENTWGVIVIPPTKTAPHVIVKDTHRRSRGDIYVRRGTITDKALPSDYARFFRLHLDEEVYQLKQQIRELRRDVEQLSGLRSMHINLPESNITSSSSAITPSVLTDDLIFNINKLFQSKADPISYGLIKQAQVISNFLLSSTIAWSVNSLNKEIGDDILSSMESISLTFWKALAGIIVNDKDGEYDEVVIDAVNTLAYNIEAPTGTRYNDLGVYVRYYPLVMSLYIIFIVGISKKRHSLLKRVKDLELKSRSYYEDPLSIVQSLFHIRAATEIFQTRNPNYPNNGWCDAVGSCIKDFFINKLDVNINIWDQVSDFYIGEFFLCILSIDVIQIGRPASGAFYYIRESDPIIRRFLSKESKWIQELFSHQLKTILSKFDEIAPRIAHYSRCWGEGFQSGALNTVFPENIFKNLNK